MNFNLPNGWVFLVSSSEEISNKEELKVSLPSERKKVKLGDSVFLASLDTLSLFREGTISKISDDTLEIKFFFPSIKKDCLSFESLAKQGIDFKLKTEELVPLNAENYLKLKTLFKSTKF